MRIRPVFLFKRFQPAHQFRDVLRPAEGRQLQRACKGGQVAVRVKEGGQQRRTLQVVLPRPRRQRPQFFQCADCGNAPVLAQHRLRIKRLDQGNNVSPKIQRL